MPAPAGGFQTCPARRVAAEGYAAYKASIDIREEFPTSLVVVLKRN